MADKYLLEDGSGGYLLEDGSGYYLLDDLAIVNNVGTTVSYLGGQWFHVEKASGTAAFNADAVSNNTLTGDIEVIIELGLSSGNIAAGINHADPTTTSTYVGSTNIIYDTASVYLYDRTGAQVGSGHAKGSNVYARLAYTASDDTARLYLSTDGATWGSALESTVVGAGTTTFYFDSSIVQLGPAFNVVFRPIAAAATTNVTIQGQTTPSPSLAKSTGKLLLSSSTPSPRLLRSTGKPILVSSALSPSLVRAASKAVRTTSTPSPSLARAVAKLLRTTSTPAPMLLANKVFLKALQAQSTPAPALKRDIAKRVTVSVTPSPSLVRAVAKLLLASSTPVPSLSTTKVKLVSLQGQSTLSPTLTFNRTYQVDLQAVVGGVASVGTGPQVVAFFRR